MALSKFLLPILLTVALLATGCSSDDGEATRTGDDIANLDEQETSRADGESTADDSTLDDGNVFSDDGVSESESSESGAVTTSPALPPLEPEESAQQFSQCIRNEGIADFPDLGIDDNGNIDLDALPNGFQGDSEMQDAFNVCQPIIEAGGFAERIQEIVASPEFNDSLIDFSDCVRDEGLDVGDLTVLGLAGAALGGAPLTDGNPQGDAGEAGVGDQDGIFAKALALDPEDPKVQAAIKKCIPAIEGAMANLGLDG